MYIKKALLTCAVLAFIPDTQADQLGELVAGAVLSSPQVKEAMHARNAVYEDVRIAKGGYLPTLDISAAGGYEWTENRTTAARGDGDEDLLRREALISLRQMLFDGFLTPNEVNRHTARLESYNYRLRNVAEAKALEVTRTYLEVLKRQELLNQANETLYNHVKVFDQIKRRAESGLGTRASKDQAQGRLALAEVNVLSAENNLLDAKTSMQRVLGRAVPALEPILDFSAPVVPETPDQAVQHGLNNHPVLKFAQADVDAAYYQYRSAKSALYPSLNFEVDRTWSRDADGSRGENEDLTAMLRLSYNLYRGGKDKARIRQTQHQVNEATAIQNNAKRETVESIELSWNAYEILGRQLEFLQQHVESSTETRNSYFKQFSIGQRSLLDLLDTESEVFSSKNAYISAKYDHLIARYRLLSGMGDMLDTLQVDTTALLSTDFQKELVEFNRVVPASQ